MGFSLNIKNMNLEKFKNRLKIEIRYADLDTYRHVNNKAFISFLEDARIYYMKEVMNFIPENLDFEAVVGRIDISYLAPLFLYDDVWVYTRCSKIGTKSYDLESYIVKKKEGEEIITSKAIVTLVSYNLEKGISKNNNAEMIELIKKYEGIS